jgi:hypothetical protein
MAKTIQLKRETVNMLKGYKEQLHLNTYNEVIRKVLIKKPKTMFGFLGKKNMKEILRGLRDESDRI